MVNVAQVRRKRDVVIMLEIDNETLETARTEILRKLNESEISGDIATGPWVIHEDQAFIAFENEMCGCCISNADIERAIANKGTTISI